MFYKFWQRQKARIKAWLCRNANCLSNNHNEESGYLAKPRRARLQSTISVVVLFVKGATIPGKARLGYGAL